MWPFKNKEKKEEMMVPSLPKAADILIEVEVEINICSEVVVKNNRTDKEFTLFSINPYGIHWQFKESGTLVIQQLLQYSETKPYEEFRKDHIGIFRDHSIIKFVHQKNMVKVKRKKSQALSI